MSLEDEDIGCVGSALAMQISAHETAMAKKNGCSASIGMK
jgi:hypothetical protein